ncbi:hypothetical protein EPN44_02225 [bacterium]|nr:MAG: hypothetical protein EPN44_02225 [bacterium]
MRRVLLAIALTMTLAACAKSGGAPAQGPSYTGVGYVRVEDAVRRHPLYAQLKQYDEEIALLQGAGVPAPPVDAAELARREAELQHSLTAAAADAKAELGRLQQHYEQQEHEAVAAALKAAGAAPGGAGGAGVVSGVASDFQRQAKEVDQRAQQSFDAYRDQVIAQDRAQLAAAAKRLADEADRKYRDKEHGLSSAEAQLAQELAQESAPQRLELRTKLQNLALDQAARKALEDQLQALDQADADQVAELRNRDQKALGAYQSELQGDVQSKMQAYSAQVHRDTNAKLEQRAGLERDAIQKQVRALAPQVSRQLDGFELSKMPPPLRARVESIHRDFLNRYQADAQGELDRFDKTRQQLSARYAALHGAVGAADAQTAKEVARLQHDRDQLYAKIVDQVESRARAIGQRRGLKVVLGGAIAAGTGVDLTDDVERDLEKSHA